MGRARVRIELTPDGPGTRISMTEDVIGGPAVVVPRPVRAAALRVRNTETLHRLALLAERRTAP